MVAEIYKYGKCHASLIMFEINGIWWSIVFLPQESHEFMRSDGSYTVGVTDFGQRKVFLSELLHGDFLRKVLCHEIVHCFCFSYDIQIPIETEEMIADFVATYGQDVINLTMNILDDITIQKRMA